MHPITPFARVWSIAMVAALLLVACGDDDPTASVAFAEPAAGATVHGSVQLAMTADGITIEEAGEARDGAGHFHVIADAGCLAAGTAIGKDADHIHFGAGQSEGVIYLDPGEHDLCLQVGDGAHSALDVTDTVSMTVAITSQEEWCEVITDVDGLSSALDAEQSDFAAVQVGFENMARLLAQLDDASQLVDDEARDDVRAALGFGANVARAFTTAADEAAAFEAVEELYAGAPAGFVDELPGADWIQATCDVDLED